MADFIGEVAGLPIAVAGLSITALWAAYTYSQSRRNERAEWLHELFTDVYMSGQLTPAKNAIEYRYDDYLAPLLERRMNDRHVPISDDEVETLDQLDNFLNYIEHVLGLQSKGLMTQSERKIVFDYWPNILGQADSYAALRRYISMCGYEKMNEELALENTDYLAVYGSLMTGLQPVHQPDFMTELELVDDVLIPGSLYEVVGGSYPYPGLTPAAEPEDRILHPARRSTTSGKRREERKLTAIRGELYRVKDAAVFQAMDEWEGYDAADPNGSPYVRRICRMLEPAIDAWVYLGNHTDRSRTIPHRSWRDRLAELESYS